jgi:hypothetical protein
MANNSAGTKLGAASQPLNREQLLVWEIGGYLANLGFGMYRLFKLQYPSRIFYLLASGDKLFLTQKFLDVLDWGSRHEAVQAAGTTASL